MLYLGIPEYRLPRDVVEGQVREIRPHDDRPGLLEFAELDQLLAPRSRHLSVFYFSFFTSYFSFRYC